MFFNQLPPAINRVAPITGRALLSKGTGVAAVIVMEAKALAGVSYATNLKLPSEPRAPIVLSSQDKPRHPKKRELPPMKKGLALVLKLADEPFAAIVPPTFSQLTEPTFQEVKLNGVIDIPVTSMFVLVISARPKVSPADLLMVIVPVAFRVASLELVMFEFSAGSPVQ